MSDGRFAVSGGFTAERAAALTESTGLAAEAHIMAVDPLEWVDAWTEFCRLVIVHVESRGWRRAVDRIVARGSEPGLALSPGTPARVVPAGMTALLMSITPGDAGSAFDAGVLRKAATLNATGRVGLDGGVQLRHVEAVATVVDWVVVGTDLFSPGGAERWRELLAAGRADPAS